MKNLGRLFLGLLTALASSLFVLAAASLSLVEGGGMALLRSTATPEQSQNITAPAPPNFLEGTLSPVPVTPTQSCPYPDGWSAHQIMQGETLGQLAAVWGTTEKILYEKNCLLSDSLVVGSTLYHPEITSPTPTLTLTLTATTPIPGTTLTETATVTSTIARCGTPNGWVPYYVKRGDTLFRIGLAYGITVDYLMFANCLTNDAIQVGQRLFVPNVATRVPSPTQTPTDEPPPPPPPTKTHTPEPPPTDIPTVQPTVEPTMEPTNIPLPTEPVPTNSYPPYPPPDQSTGFSISMKNRNVL
jgi:LysM repeat protein